MTVPLIAAGGRAACSPAGWACPSAWTLFGERFRGFERWLEPAFASAAAEAAKGGAHDASIEWILMGLSVAVAIVGIVVARYFYHHKPEIPGLARRVAQAAAQRCSTTSGTWTRFTISCSSTAWAKAAASVLGAFDRNVVDGGVNGAGWLTRFSSTRLHVVGYLDRGWRGALQLVLREAALLSRCASCKRGRVQAYALFVVVGVLVFFGYYRGG